MDQYNKDNHQQSTDSQVDSSAEEGRKSDDRTEENTDAELGQKQHTEESTPSESEQVQHTEAAATQEEEPATGPESKAKQRSEKNTAKSPKNYVGMIFSGLIGGIIAAVAVLLLVTNNIIPIDTATESEQTTGEDESQEVVETLATADDANVAGNISEVSEAVVGVVNLQQQSVWEDSQQAGTGSGIIYKKEDGNAYIVTNQHVVEGAEEVEVVLSEEQRLPAQVLGSDPLNDLAVLEVDGENIDTVASFSSSEDVQVGETVLAIGNPLGLEFANSVTRGIISGLDRSVNVDTNRDGRPDWITEVIQTDAAINPGNSGGALVNTNGEVIGINSMKVAQGAVEGIGFAIPTDTAMPIIEQLETEGEIVRPQIGVTIASLYQVPPQYRYEINLPDEIEGGMVVADIATGSPADEAGLQQFDVITKINDQEVTTLMELRTYLYSEADVGDTVEIEYVRNGETQTTELQLEAREQPEEAQPAQ